MTIIIAEDFIGGYFDESGNRTFIKGPGTIILPSSLRDLFLYNMIEDSYTYISLLNSQR